MIVQILQYFAGGIIIFGALFSLLAAVGILRLPDLYTRMHSVSKAGTMGAGLMFVAIAAVSFEGAVILRALAGFVFLFLTMPVASHLLARAALLAGYKPASFTDIKDLDVKELEE
jgi:multicomponent Na+:H+ antiporter subunit G